MPRYHYDGQYRPQDRSSRRHNPRMARAPLRIRAAAVLKVVHGFNAVKHIQNLAKAAERHYICGIITYSIISAMFSLRCFITVLTATTAVSIPLTAKVNLPCDNENALLQKIVLPESFAKDKVWNFSECEIIGDPVEGTF